MSKAKNKADALLDELLADCKTPEDILGQNGLIKQLTKRAVERALNGELTAHLGYAAHDRAEERRSNTRNGTSTKTVMSEHGPLVLEVPRDRDGSFEPQLVRKGQRRLAEIDQQILALYARGLTTREIQGHLQELYGVEVSPTLISTVTEEVMAEVRSWQNRPLAAMYPVIYFDALYVKSRQTGVSAARAVYLALGVNLEGHKELLGLWIGENEGAAFWLSILTELNNRGMQDCLIACVDGLAGFPEALAATFPKAQAQLCIVHKVRASLRYVPSKDRKAVAASLRDIYAAPTLQAAEDALQKHADAWSDRYPVIAQQWRRDWAHLSAFFDYPPDIRKVIYTTNAIESLNYSLRRVLKNRGAFPDDAAITKILYLAIRRASQRWTMPIQNWSRALNRFTIMFPDRMPA